MKISRWHKIGVTAVIVATLYALGGWLLGPRVVARGLQRHLAAPTGLTVGYEDIRVNPFTLTAAVTGLSLSAPGGEVPLLAERAVAGLGLAMLWRSGLNLRRLALERPRLSLSLGSERTTRLLDWIEPRPIEDRAVSIGALAVRQGELRLSGPESVRLDFEQVTLTASEIGTTGGRYALSATPAFGGRLELVAQAGASPLTAAGSFELDGFELTRLLRSLDPTPTAAVSGTLAVRGDFSADRRAGVSLADTVLELRRFELSDASGGRALGLDRVDAAGVEVNFAGRTVQATRVALADGSVTLTTLASALERLVTATAAWAWAVDRVELQALAIEAGAPEPGWQFDAIDGVVSGLASGSNAPAPFSLTMRVNQSARLQATGSLTAAAPELAATIELTDLELSALAPYLGLAPPLELDSGLASAEATLTYRPGRTRLDGRIQWRDLALVDRVSRAPLLTAAAGEVAGLIVDGSPPRASIDVIRLTEPALSLTLTPDGLTPSAGFTERPIPVRLDRIEITGGALALTDARLMPPLVLRAGEVEGAADGLAASSEQTARLQLAGRVEGAGAGKLAITWQPGQARRQRSIDLLLGDIEQPLLAAYAAHYAGREIESGSASLGLRYRFAGNRFTGRHRLVVDDLRLGQRLERAPALPLDLAVALFQGPDGRLELTVPAVARLEGPDPNLGAVVANAAYEFLTTLEAAPFRVLGELVGVPGNELGSVAFEPGSAALTAGAERRLGALREALERRPALALRIAGGYAATADRAALARQQMRLHVALATSAGPPGGSGQDPPAFADAKVQTVLDEFAGERLDAAERAAIGARFANRDRAAYYAAVFEALVANEPIADSALKKLARFRAQSIVGRLGALGLPSERLRLDEPVAVAGEDSRVVVPLGLEPSGADELPSRTDADI